MSGAPISTQREDERVFLIGLQVDRMKRAEAEASLEELERLAETTRDAAVVGSDLAHIRAPDPGTFFSRGLVEQLRGAIRARDAGTAIIDGDITPAQQNNLQESWGVKLINRSELILDIFAQRAHTSEGKIQVELAQLRYRLPRLRGLGIRLSRLGGGIGTRGPGEKMLETDRRALVAQIHSLEHKLEKIRRRRETQRARRQAGPAPSVALVGYTNAGKSTLLNALTGSDVFVEDKLFATLGATTRRARLESGAAVTLTDTVGFINRLPTALVAAFRATLEEVLYADILVHVVDATSPRWEQEIHVTNEVLKDLGAGATPSIVAWNKIDALDAEAMTPERFERIEPGSVAISALEGAGLERLMAGIQDLIDQTRPRVWLRFGHDEYGELARLRDSATVHKIEHRPGGIHALASLSEALLQRYADRLDAEADPGPVERVI